MLEIHQFKFFGLVLLARMLLAPCHSSRESMANWDLTHVVWPHLYNDEWPQLMSTAPTAGCAVVGNIVKQPLSPLQKGRNVKNKYWNIYCLLLQVRSFSTPSETEILLKGKRLLAWIDIHLLLAVLSGKMSGLWLACYGLRSSLDRNSSAAALLICLWCS